MSFLYHFCHHPRAFHKGIKVLFSESLTILFVHKKGWGCWGKDIKKASLNQIEKLYNWENPTYLSLQIMTRVSWGETHNWVVVFTIITSEIKLHIVQSYLNEKGLSKEAKLMCIKFPNITKIYFLESQTVKCPVLSNQSQKSLTKTVYCTWFQQYHFCEQKKTSLLRLNDKN